MCEAYGDITFFLSSAFTSYLQLSIRHLGDHASSEINPTHVRLSHDSCRKLELMEIDRSTYNQFLLEENAVDSGHRYYIVFIEYDRLCSENLFLESPPLPLLLVRDSIESTSKLGLVLKEGGGSQFREDFSSLIARFRTENQRTRSLEVPLAFLARREGGLALKRKSAGASESLFLCLARLRGDTGCWYRSPETSEREG